MKETGHRSGAAAASLVGRLAVVFILVVAVVGVFYLKGNRVDGAHDVTAAQSGGLPKLVDLGSDKCIPCKTMAPILVKLSEDYAGRFETVFIDVWKEHSRAKPYEFRVIPTQVFMDAAGKELFRHEGFMSRAEILAAWKNLGYEFEAVSQVEEQ